MLISCRFLKRYDSDNRQPLLEAYHDQAVFSMSCTTNKNIPGRLVKINHFISFINRTIFIKLCLECKF